MKLMYLFNSGCGAFHGCAQHLTKVKGTSSKEMTGEQMWKKFKNLKNTFNDEHTPVLREILIDPGHTLPTGTVWKNVPDMFETQLFLREHKVKWTKKKSPKRLREKRKLMSTKLPSEDPQCVSVTAVTFPPTI